MTYTFITIFPSMSKLRLWIFICIIFVQQVGLFLLYAQEHESSLTSIWIPTNHEESSTTPNIWENENKNLIISEVYFDGSDEFIEISNISDLDYNSTITITQDTNKKQSLILQIPAHQSTVLAYKNSRFPWDYILSFGLTDNSAINLKLSDTNGILDTFDVEQALVKKRDNKKTSFEKIYENQSRKIVPTTLERSQNSPEGFIANPWYFNKETDSIEEITESNTDNSQDTTSNENSNTSQASEVWPTTSPHLIITEAFFNKDNNRIEISNISNIPFEGEISINWFVNEKKISTQISIPANSTIILAKNNKFFEESLISADKIKILKNLPTIDWKKDLDLTLSYGNQSDELKVHLDRVKRIKWLDQSFEKLLINETRITTRNMERRANIRGKIMANPWIYFTQWENLKDISQPKNQNTQNPSEEESPLCQQINDQYLINIKEVFAGNESYPAFVELYFLDDPKDISQLKLSWPMFDHEVIFYKDEDFWEKWKTILLSANTQRSEKGIDNIISSNFSINSQSWVIVLEWNNGQDRQVLDIINVKDLQTGKSSYSNGNKSEWCIKNFDQNWDFSPWFDRKFLQYFKIETAPRVEYIYVNKWGGWGGYSCPTKADLCPSSESPTKAEKKDEKAETKAQQSQKNDNPIQDTEDIWENNQHIEEKPISQHKEHEDYQVKIEDLIYDPPGSDTNKETITLLLTKGEGLDLKKTTLVIDGKNKKINGILKYWESKTLVGNFGFPNTKKDKSNVVVQLKLWNQLLDTFIYSISDKSTSEKEKKQENKKEGIKVFSVLDGDTFRYKDSNWKLQSVRLIWVDSPESNTARYRKTECYGKEAKQALTNLIKGKTIKLESDPNQHQHDNYGRQLAYVWLDDLLINQHLISEGFAKEYTFKTAYSKQADFQSAQAQAKAKKIWLRSPVNCPNNLENEESAEENSKNLVIKITHIDYDPKGADKNNESISLSIFNKNKDISSIDFSKQWGALVFDRTENYQSLDLEELENSKGKFIDLSHFGQQTITNPLVLRGNFNLPNTKSSCVALFQKDHLYDIACYQTKEKQPENTISYLTWSIKITAILPNPKGKDQGKEFIELQSYIQEDVDLSSWFSILINGKTKKKITGTLLAWEKKRITGNFSFSNDHSCVSIVHQSQILDTFCYGKEKEGSIITKDKTILSQQSTEDLAILKKIKFAQKNKQRCIVYENTILKCRNIPRSKTDPLLKAENTMHRKAFKLFNQMIKEKYSPLYYQSDLMPLFNLIKEGKEDFKKKKTTTQIYGDLYNRSDFDKIYQAKYEQQIWKQGIYFFKELFSL